MSLLRTTRYFQPFHRTNPSMRTLSTTRFLQKDPPAPGNQPPSAKSAGRTTHVSEDPQSSASTSENKSGDDHPAKQPDPQADSERSTGFHEVKGGVKGGKEGLGQRSDK